MRLYGKQNEGGSVKLVIREESTSTVEKDTVENRRYFIRRPPMIGPVTWVLSLATHMNQLGLEGRRIMSFAVLGDGSVDFTTRRKGVWTR